MLTHVQHTLKQNHKQHVSLVNREEILFKLKKVSRKIKPKRKECRLVEHHLSLNCINIINLVNGAREKQNKENGQS